MADNVTANPGAAGATFVTAELTWSGDTAHASGGFLGILTGSEGAWTYTLLPGGEGAVSAGTPRVTLASDDPAVALLTTIDADTSTLAAVDFATQTTLAAILADTAAMDTNLATIAGDTTSLDGKVTACNTGAVVISSGTVTANLSATDNAVLDTIDAVLDTINAKLVTGTVIGDVNLGATDNAVLDTIASPVATISATPLQRVAIFDAADAQITSFGGGTEYTAGTDTYAEATSKIKLAGAVRNDTLATLANTDNEMTVLQVNADGALWVVPVAGAAQSVDDTTTHATGTTEAINIAFVATPTDGTVDANDIGMAAMSLDRRVLTDTQIVGQDANLTVDLGATDNAVLDAIAAKDFATQTTLAAVLADTAAMDTNLATIAGDTTSLDGKDFATQTTLAAINTKLTSGTVIGDVNLGATDNAVLDSIVTNTTGLAGTVSGSELQVDVVAALPAGTNAIGKLAANTGVDIGDVDVTSIATGTNAIGRVGHDTTGIGHGVKTVTTAGTDLALTTTTAAKWVTIQAQTDNTGIIAVGATGVDATVATGTGVALAAGESITIPCDDLADVFIDSTVNGEGVRYTYGT